MPKLADVEGDTGGSETERSLPEIPQPLIPFERLPIETSSSTKPSKSTASDRVHYAGHGRFDSPKLVERRLDHKSV